MFEIPLIGGAVNSHQEFNVQLGDNFLEFRLNFITRSLEEPDFAPWVLDILREGELLVAGAALVPGSDIIEHFGAGIGKLFFIGDQPTLDNLGQSNSLIWEEADE